MRKETLWERKEWINEKSVGNKIKKKINQERACEE